MRRARDRDPGARRRQLLPDARRPAPAHRRRAPAAHQLAAEPDRDGDRSRRAAPDLRDGRRGEPPPRARRAARRSGSATTRCTGSSCSPASAAARDAARGVPRRRAVHDHPRRGVEELRRHRVARRLGGDAAGGAPADGGHPGPRRRVGAAARAGGDGGAAGRRGRDRRLRHRHARARARAPRPPGRRVRGDARGRLPGRGDRAAGGDLPVGAGGDSGADERGDAAAAADARGLRAWSPSRRSACARTAAGSASRSAPCRWPRSTPPSRACGPRCRDGNRGARHPGGARAGVRVTRRRCSRSPTTNTATRRCAR